jgi:hypothetical protein
MSGCLVSASASVSVLLQLRRALGRLLQRMLLLLLVAVGQIGWRTSAALIGVLGAGWIASVVPAMLDTAARASAPGQAAALHVGTIAQRSVPGGLPDWMQVVRPIAAFGLGIPDLDGQPIRHGARRDRNSAAREDVLQAGEFSAPAVHLRLAVQRDPIAPASNQYLALTRLAAEAGLAVERSAQPRALASKFGPIEAADVMLGQGQHVRHCLAFRHVAEDRTFGFHGWLCGQDGMTADRQRLTCLVDRLNLLAAGEARELRGHFSKAELNRQASCMLPKLQQAGRRTTWLEDGQAPPPLRRGG